MKLIALPILLAAVALAGAEVKTLRPTPAPALTGSHWLNGKAESFKGRVTVLHFWTFGCINCKRNLSAYNRWQHKFAGQNVQVVGVHTPETAAERNERNVAAEVKRLGITYSMLTDTNSENWNRWHQEFWPTVYVIDKAGHLRYQWVGELAYNGAHGEAQIAQRVTELLAEK